MTQSICRFTKPRLSSESEMTPSTLMTATLSAAWRLWETYFSWRRCSLPRAVTATTASSMRLNIREPRKASTKSVVRKRFQPLRRRGACGEGTSRTTWAVRMG